MFLEKIKSPSDLKKIPVKNLPILSSEIRQRIIQVVSKTGGHLASNLGIVELAIAIHYCLDMPKDKVIWDVGHQAYTHKLLTGRNEIFDTLRQFQGMSGFPTREESEYDIFTTGHSSTAISLALGLAAARDMNKTKEKIVAVIGDGSLSGGLCFEALNNAGHLKKDLLVILNTNEMSISPAVGALSNYLNKIISQPIYNRFKEALENFIKTRIPKVGSRIFKLSAKFEEVLKGLIVPGIFFEELGFRYFGPLDGHNLELLIKTLRNIVSLKEPRILHVVTKKGKGYGPSENRPVSFHSAPAFDIKTGLAKVANTEDRLTYTQIFSEKMLELGKQDSRIVAITAAMPDGTGLSKFGQEYPERFFDVGIAEGHAICFAAGLARGGLKPVVAIYSTFLQRAYDQLIEEVSLQDTGVVLAIDRAGIVGADGVTHQGIFDIVYLRSIPKIIIMAPKDEYEFAKMLEFAVRLDRPVAIRYPKDMAARIEIEPTDIQLGKFEVLRYGRDVAIIAFGSMVYPSLIAAEELARQHISAHIINARFASPLDRDLLAEVSHNFKKIVTIEEGITDGGFGIGILEKINSIHAGPERPQLKIIGLPKAFITHGKRDLLLDKYGLSPQGIANSVRDFLLKDSKFYAQSKLR
jgi:1-deoxy-D-xylulose-5-phosphate synthase